MANHPGRGRLSRATRARDFIGAWSYNHDFQAALKRRFGDGAEPNIIGCVWIDGSVQVPIGELISFVSEFSEANPGRLPHQYGNEQIYETEASAIAAISRLGFTRGPTGVWRRGEDGRWAHVIQYRSGRWVVILPD